MKYGIAIFPSKEIQDYANSYRKRYDPHYKRIPPHITVREAFDIVAEDQLEEIVSQLTTVTKATAPFDVQLNKVGTFYPVNHVIYFGLAPNEALLKLHDALNSEIEDGRSSYPFVPHLTIGQHMSAEETHDVYARIKQLGIDFVFTADHIYLLYQMEDGGWTVYQTFLLEGNQQ